MAQLVQARRQGLMGQRHQSRQWLRWHQVGLQVQQDQERLVAHQDQTGRSPQPHQLHQRGLQGLRDPERQQYQQVQPVQVRQRYQPVRLDLLHQLDRAPQKRQLGHAVQACLLRHPAPEAPPLKHQVQK